jgi:hypothetical protein
MNPIYTYENSTFKVGSRKAEPVLVNFWVEDYSEVLGNELLENCKTKKVEYPECPFCLNGELTVDFWHNGNYFKEGTNGTLRIQSNDKHTTSMIDIVLLREESVSFVAKHRKRYLWVFNSVGKPILDDLELFPKRFTMPVMKVYIVNDFQGFTPLPVAGYVLAKSEWDARELFNQQLKSKGLDKKQYERFTLKELDLTKPQASILVDGGDF